MSLIVGKANYNANRGEKLTFFRLGMKDNQRELIVRLAPPIKDLADKGAYATYVKQHFGYTSPGKGDKRFPQTFLCVEKRDRNKNIVQSCPECDEIAFRKIDVEAKKARLETSGASPEVIEAQLRPARGWLKEHNCDKKWNLLAKNESGVWGFLAISHTCCEDLRREIMDLQKIGISDPLGVEEGVWFRFSRSGTTFNNISDTVSAVKIATGKGGFAYKTDTLTDKDLASLESLPALTSLGRRITFEQIASLVASGGDEEVVKSVFQSASAVQSETSPVATAQATTVFSTATPAPAQASPTPAAATSTVATAAMTDPASNIQAQMEALQRQLEQMKALSAAPVLTPAPTPSAGLVSPTLTKSLNMDVDNFISEFGDQ